jgi:hypothetical protein
MTQPVIFRRRAPARRTQAAAASLLPLLALAFACLESALLVAAGQLASAGAGLR